MRQKKLSQASVQNHQTLRSTQSDTLELLAAVFETESASAVWLADQRINADRETRAHLS